MGTPLSLEAKQLLKQLADGEWRKKEDVVEALAPTVPPGRALRKFDSTAMPAAHRLNAEPTDYEKIRMGQRRVAMIVIRSLRRRFLESEMRGGVEWIRLRSEPRPLAKSKVFRVPDADPGDELRQCERCGGYILTSSQDDHDNYHAMNDASPDDVGALPQPAGTSGDPQGVTEAQIHAAVGKALAVLVSGDALRRLIGQEVSLAIGGRLMRQLVRDEVASVMDQSLDEFQAGMQRFLSGWMDEVEQAMFMTRVTRTALLGRGGRTQATPG